MKRGRKILFYFTGFIFLSCVALLVSSRVYRSIHNTEAAKFPTPLFVDSTGEGKDAIVFLHGLATTHVFWNNITTAFEKQFKIISPDLLGFGYSRWPDEEPTLEDHLQALHKTLEIVLPNRKFHLIGHSLGALLALQYAARFPEKVESVLILSPPVFHSRADAIQKLSKASKIMPLLAFGIVGKLVCELHQGLIPIIKPILPYILSDLPKEVAEAAALHTWKSYLGAMDNIILNSPMEKLLPRLANKPAMIVHAQSDLDADSSELQKLSDQFRIKYLEIEGGHDFVLTNRELTVSILDKFLKP